MDEKGAGNGDFEEQKGEGKKWEGGTAFGRRVRGWKESAMWDWVWRTMEMGVAEEGRGECMDR